MTGGESPWIQEELAGVAPGVIVAGPNPVNSSRDLKRIEIAGKPISEAKFDFAANRRQRRASPPLVPKVVG